MHLPVMPPVRPMLAKSVSIMPAGMLYEPKWDGFRCVVFRDGDEVELGSRNERPMTRYFPELVEAARLELPRRCVVDGEVVVAGGAGLDFEALLQRIHPADSRVRLLAQETPALLIAFDLLALDDQSLMEQTVKDFKRINRVDPNLALSPEMVTAILDFFSKEAAGKVTPEKLANMEIRQKVLAALGTYTHKP